ncbi:MAG: thioredoxin family protein [Bdellovibrionales bacterium]|nr:thioredoxin family protein [Bdellovibrionales bacterium]
MALMHTQVRPGFELGQFKAPDFNLPGVDGKSYSLKNFQDSKALVVIFMCNHCPYVIAVQDRINDLAKRFKKQGVALIGINPNDPVKYPADNFEAMKVRAQERGFEFPYVQDESQDVARAYDAVCTPDPYVFENLKPGQGTDFVLRYHGRIDDNWKEPAQVKAQELATALEQILAGRTVNPDQKSAMGCSIKWKESGKCS